ncbi:MAG: hypothetical protein SGI98_09855 [Verrucomicrobiota bacterium]|nr:hypothetical protein [Verrucomicrobiota bacterium]
MNRNASRYIAAWWPRRDDGGFTLLEMTLAIVLAVMFSSMLVPLFDTVVVEKRLRAGSSLYSEFAQTAFRESLKEGITYEVRWNDKTIELMKYAPAQNGGGKEPEIVKVQDIPRGITVTNLYSVAKGDEPNQWSFYPTGVCQPMRLKLMLGGSWIDLTFSPLTASVIEESYAF